MSVVFLFDVDNTLLDNDRVAADLRSYLAQTVGGECSDRYWHIFETLRSELGYADYLGALQRYRVENPYNPEILKASSYLIDYPFRERLYPDVEKVLAHLHKWGPTVILSDGDGVFQPRKVVRSGLWDAFEGRVLIYIHKEEMLDDVERKYPADHYVMVDDKLRVLAAMRRTWGTRLTTIWPVQGHYAHDPNVTREYPIADIRLERIGDLVNMSLDLLLHATRQVDVRKGNQ